jgi:DNA-binding Lrp family transcriptional regulator
VELEEVVVAAIRRHLRTGGGRPLRFRRSIRRLIVFVTMQQEDQRPIAAFEAQVAAVPAIVPAQRLFGNPDYLLRVVAADLDAYRRIYDEQLAALPGVQRLTSTLVMKDLVGGAGSRSDARSAARRAPLMASSCFKAHATARRPLGRVLRVARSSTWRACGLRDAVPCEHHGSQSQDAPAGDRSDPPAGAMLKA